MKSRSNSDPACYTLLDFLSFSFLAPPHGVQDLPQPGLRLTRLPALGAQNPNHWAAGKSWILQLSVRVTYFLAFGSFLFMIHYLQH